MSQKESKYYLLEEYGGLLDPGGSKIIALSPQAAFSLDSKGLSYAMPDDYYDERELRAAEDKYFSEQLAWIDDLDSIIKNGLELCRNNNISLLRNIFYLPFKYIVDHIIIETRVIRSFIEKAKPKEIVYVYDSRKRKNPKNLYRWIDEGTNFYKEILSAMADKYGFSLSAIDLAGKVSTLDTNTAANGRLYKAYLLMRRAAKSVYLAVKHNKAALLFGHKKSDANRLNILFLHSGCQPIDFLIKDFLSKGANVFVKENSAIFYENNILRKKVLDLGKEGQDEGQLNKVRSEVEALMPALYGKGRLLEWVSERASIDVTSILKPFLKYFFEDMVVGTVVESLRIADFCSKNRIDYIAARAGTDSDPVSGLLASKCIKGLKSVCLQHGCYALDFKMLHITEAGMFDIYFTSDDLSEKYFKEESLSYSKNRCLVFQEPHALQRIRRVGGGKGKGGKVLYIPANHSFYLRYFNNMDYPATWYYKFQKDILDFLATKKDVTFIYKHSGHHWCQESIVSYILKKGYKNIIVENGRIPEYLPMVEKVIMDCPSTPLFEAAAFGMPVLAIYRDYMPYWKPAAEYFDKSLQPFSNTSEAIEKIDKFLKASPEGYFKSLPMHSGSTYQTLFGLKGQN